MRNLLLTTNVGGVLCANARASLTAAATRWKCDYLELTTPEGPAGCHPCYTRWFTAPTLVRWARVLSIDADVLIRANAPSPFTAFPNHNAFHAVADVSPRWTPSVLARIVEDVRERWYLPLGGPEFAVSKEQYLTHYFNGGWALFSPTVHAAVFARFAAKAAALATTIRRDRLAEQSLINLCVHDVHGPATLVDSAWNFIDPSPLRPMLAYCYHFTGAHGGRIRRRLATYDWKALPPS